VEYFTLHAKHLFQGENSHFVDFHQIAINTSKSLFPLKRFTATESSSVVVIFTSGNGHRGRISPIERAATMSIACENRAAFRFPRRKTGLYVGVAENARTLV
jgi:hypothetical protein